MKYATNYNMIAVIGATAGGKTSFAAHLAHKTDGEIISADSRQVYRGMDIGTGKDYDDYIVEGEKIPCHLIDIVDAGYKYNVYEYQKDAAKCYLDIKKRKKLPILCGGSGMYIEAVIKGYKLIEVPPDESLRNELEKKTMEELVEILKSKKTLHNTTDVDTKKRAIRAIEIEMFYKQNPHIDRSYPDISPKTTLLLGIKFDRLSRRRRISERLKQRLDEGMVNEVKKLLDSGLSPEQLIYYGLEYKFLTKYVMGELSYNQMFSKLETAIHQFSKRQMTWFRGMERRGLKIHWLDGYMPIDEKVDKAIQLMKKQKQ